MGGEVARRFLGTCQHRARRHAHPRDPD